MTLGSWLVFGAIMAAFAAVVVSLVRSRRHGGCSSCGSCSRCPHGGQCPHTPGEP